MGSSLTERGQNHVLWKVRWRSQCTEPWGTGEGHVKQKQRPHTQWGFHWSHTHYYWGHHSKEWMTHSLQDRILPKWKSQFLMAPLSFLARDLYHDLGGIYKNSQCPVMSGKHLDLKLNFVPVRSSAHAAGGSTTSPRASLKGLFSSFSPLESPFSLCSLLAPI